MHTQEQVDCHTTALAGVYFTLRAWVTETEKLSVLTGLVASQNCSSSNFFSLTNKNKEQNGLKSVWERFLDELFVYTGDFSDQGRNEIASLSYIPSTSEHSFNCCIWNTMDIETIIISKMLQPQKAAPTQPFLHSIIAEASQGSPECRHVVISSLHWLENPLTRKPVKEILIMGNINYTWNDKADTLGTKV